MIHAAFLNIYWKSCFRIHLNLTVSSFRAGILFFFFFFFCEDFFFEIGFCELWCLGWLQTAILLIFATWVARITGMSHWCLAFWKLFTHRDWNIWLPTFLDFGVSTKEVLCNADEFVFVSKLVFFSCSLQYSFFVLYSWYFRYDVMWGDSFLVTSI
jgi:hypothetical protein